MKLYRVWDRVEEEYWFSRSNGKTVFRTPSGAKKSWVGRRYSQRFDDQERFVVIAGYWQPMPGEPYDG